MGKMNDAQFLFFSCLWKLLKKIEDDGNRATIGDVWAVDFNPLIKDLDAMEGLTENNDLFRVSVKMQLRDRKHSPNSKHYDKLAVDVNLFKPVTDIDIDGPFQSWEYCTSTSDHAELGAFWKSLHPACEWGGDWQSQDANHYQINKDKV